MASRIILLTLSLTALAPAQTPAAFEREVADTLFNRNAGTLTSITKARTAWDKLYAKSWWQVFQVYAATKNADLQTTLRRELGIDRAQQADFIIKGRLQHATLERSKDGKRLNLRANFNPASFKLMMAKDKQSLATLEAKSSVRLASGQVSDRWLLEGILARFHAAPPEGLWTLTTRSFANTKNAGPLEFYEFQWLPPQAIKAREDLTGICIRQPR